MNKILRITLATILLCVFTQANAAVITLDFEDLSGQSALDTNYGGLTWDSNWVHYDWAQPPYDASSGVQRIYTHNYGGWIDFGEKVTFMGSWVATSDQGQEVYWEGYRNGVKLFESAHYSGGVQDWFNLVWEGVDYVKFVSTSYNQFVIDDIKYNPVPIPAAVWLFGTGLIGLLGINKRKKSV